MQEQIEIDTIKPKKIEVTLVDTVLKSSVYEPHDLDKCKGIIIFTHGLGYCERQYKIDGRRFAQNGYLMLTYNLIGHAGSNGTWTLDASAKNLSGLITFLSTKYDFGHTDRVGVMGHSTGALITLLASLQDTRIKIGSVITTVTCLSDSFLYWFKSGYNQEVKKYFSTKGRLPPIIERFMDDEQMLELYRKGKITPEELEVPHRYGMLKSNSWNQFFHEIAYSINIIDYAHELKLPLIFFRGKSDEVMDPDKTNEFYEKINKKLQNRLVITESQDHFQNDSWGMIQLETMNFFDHFWNYL